MRAIVVNAPQFPQASSVQHRGDTFNALNRRFAVDLSGARPRRTVVERDFYDTRGGAIPLRKVACGLQPSTTTARARQANTNGIRGKVRSICGAKVGATYGNDGEHTKGGVDYDR